MANGLPAACCRSVRIFEAIKDKATDNEETYQYVVGQLRPVMDELDLSTPEELAL